MAYKSMKQRRRQQQTRKQKQQQQKQQQQKQKVMKMIQKLQKQKQQQQKQQQKQRQQLQQQQQRQRQQLQKQMAQKRSTLKRLRQKQQRKTQKGGGNTNPTKSAPDTFTTTMTNGEQCQKLAEDPEVKLIAVKPSKGEPEENREEAAAELGEGGVEGEEEEEEVQINEQTNDDKEKAKKRLKTFSDNHIDDMGFDLNNTSNVAKEDLKFFLDSFKNDELKQFIIDPKDGLGRKHKPLEENLKRKFKTIFNENYEK